MLSKFFLSILVLVSISIQPSYQDVYLHNPRGSNNRLNENSDNRNNANRVFDSQNNDKGGYNVGDATSAAAANEDQQYQMKYFSGSLLDTEWTAQHGCGTKNNLVSIECNIVLQYMCQPASSYDENNLDRIRDGLVRTSQDFEVLGSVDTEAENVARKARSVKLDRVIQETWESYDSCYLRERNRGLFTADQNLANNAKGYSSAIYTRQNPGGTRRGYECPEERDYYPYWHPSAWKDIAVFVTQPSMCSMYQSESFNIKPKYSCVETYAGTSVQKHWSRWNNQADCQKNNGVWTELYNYLEKASQFTTQQACEANKGYKWAVPFDSKNTAVKECLVLLTAPSCQVSDFSRINHLGNTQKDTEAAQYQWKLPSFPSKKLQKCAFRLRYNVSNLDYDQYAIDSNKNGANSPIKNNPQVAVDQVTLQLAINTAQTGRVFEDRSHAFYILARPSNIPDTTTIYNLNVRGKRGNIVQAYPAVEYDFLPSELKLKTNELVHIQWTGSNTNPNNAGQGAAGTDRSNFVLTKNLNTVYPILFAESSFWKDIDFLGYLSKDKLTDDTTKYLKTGFSVNDLAVYLSSSAYYDCVNASTCIQNTQQATKVDVNLNTAPASVPGVLFKFNRANSTYYYMSSRNNAFSNRDQKGLFSTN